MKLTKKLCGKCNTLQFIWKNYEGIRMCKACYMRENAKTKSVIKPTKQKRIPHSSLKRKVKDKEYAKLRKVFLTERSVCEIRIPTICQYTATDVHHTKSGADRNEFYLDVSTWMAGCRACHQWVHTISKEAKELNLLK